MIALILLQLYLTFIALPCAQATIFVTSPLNTTTCHAGQPCIVQWLDNGAAPLLNNIGPCFVGLFNGQGTLVQQLEPVNVASVHSFSFTPDPAAGPESDLYYVNFTSVNPIGNPPSVYTQYSPFFTLAEMTGSFATPVPSDTQAIPVPSTVADPSPDTVSSTIVISNSLSSPSASSTASGSSSSSASSLPTSSSFVTSRASSSQPTSSSSSSTSGTSPSHTAATSSAGPRVSSIPLWHCVFLLLNILAISLYALL